MNIDSQTPVHAAVLESLSCCSETENPDSELKQIVKQRCALHRVEQAMGIVEMTVRHLLEIRARQSDRRIRFTTQ